MNRVVQVAGPGGASAARGRLRCDFFMENMEGNLWENGGKAGKMMESDGKGGLSHLSPKK